MHCDDLKIKLAPFLDKLSKAYPNNKKIKEMKSKINNCNNNDMKGIIKIYDILIQSQLGGGNRKRRKRSGKSRRKSRRKRSRKSLRGGMEPYRFHGNSQERAERAAFFRTPQDARNEEIFRQDTIVDALSNLGLLFAAFVIFWMLGGI